MMMEFRRESLSIKTGKPEDTFRDVNLMTEHIGK
jgi:hypothetical protein